MNATKVRLGEIAMSDLQAVVDVHKASFPVSALTRLGDEAARRYYEWQLTGQPEAHFVGAWVENELGGFCCCGCFHGALGGFLSRNRLFLATQLCTHPWLLFHPEVRTAANTAFRRMWHGTPPELPPNSGKAFGILSIAVTPKHRRKGIAANLMSEAEKAAVQDGYAIINLTVNPRNSEAIKLYEKLGWERSFITEHWSGKMQKDLGNSPKTAPALPT